MRIVYIGVVDFSYHCLQEVINNNGDVVGIVACKGSESNSDYRDLTPLAEKHNIDIYYYNTNINEKETVEKIRSWKPDIIFCWGISQLLKDEILSIPPKGVIGVHGTLLPQNRGRHPLIWALALGLKESGQTFFKMDSGADSGPILSQKSYIIDCNDNATTIYQKLKKLATMQIKEFLPKLIENNEIYIQQDNTMANHWRKRSRKDGIIDWRMGKEAIYNLIRALTKPYPGAEFKYIGQSIYVWSAEIYPGVVEANLEPGKVIDIVEGYPIVKCYDGAIKLTNYEPRIQFKVGEYLQ